MMRYIKNNIWSSTLGEISELHSNKDDHKNQERRLRIHTVENLCESNEGNPCGKTFSRVPNLTVQKRNPPEVNPFECSDCEKAIMDPSSHNHHTCQFITSREACGGTTPMRPLSGKKPRKCEVCGKDFICISTLKNPVTTLTSDNQYKCNEYGKDFCSFSSFWTHVRGHKGECKESSSSDPLSLLFSNRDKPYECREFRKAFSFSSALTAHLGTHSEERPYECNECGKAFRWPSYLTKHMRTHSGERPYECQECGKGFSQSGHLTTHIRTHTGQRPYECKECGKAFSRVSTLTTHITTHSGEKPYECKQSFSQSSDLVTHRRVHTGERPYQCKEFGKAFVISRPSEDIQKLIVDDLGM
nr:zinc finger protein 239-like [Loxodonta africana]